MQRTRTHNLLGEGKNIGIGIDNDQTGKGNIVNLASYWCIPCYRQGMSCAEVCNADS